MKFRAIIESLCQQGGKTYAVFLHDGRQILSVEVSTPEEASYFAKHLGKLVEFKLQEGVWS